MRESMMKEKLQVENMRLRERLQEKETQLVTMVSLSMEELQCRQPSKYCDIFLKEQWMHFQINTFARYGSLHFQDYMHFIEFCSQNNMEDREKWLNFICTTSL